MPWVHITAGPGAGQRHELRQPRTTIGRDAANHLQIADPKSSRVHAEITVDGGRYQVRDLDSSNGTWTEDGRIASLPLSDGTEFRIGATRFRFESIVPSADEWADPSHLQGLDQAKTVLFTPPLAGDAEALARANAYLVLLHHLIRRSNVAKDREALFELLDDAAAEVLDGDRCAVFLPDEASPHGWSLWPVHERRLRARFGSVPFARTLLATIKRDGEPLLCTHGGDLAPSLSMVQAGVQSAMAAPVRVGTTIPALLYVDRLAMGQPFTRTDLEFLAAVANQMAARLSGPLPLAPTRPDATAAAKATEPPPPPAMVGDDPVIQHLREQTATLAASDLPLLICGEAGTGKELFARRLHALSPRHQRPFQVVLCAQPLQQLEAVLFGRPQAPGVIELAEGGTVFLDALTAIPVELQPHLLRLLEHGEVQRPGAVSAQRSTVRLVAALTPGARLSPELASALGEPLLVPALRDRAGDIIPLAEHFLHHGATPHQLSPEARAVLLRYPWPGNVRELRQVIEQVAVRTADRVITPADLPAQVRHVDPRQDAAPIATLATVEKAHILRVLEHCGGNKKAAAELLEIDRSTLYAKLKQYGVG